MTISKATFSDIIKATALRAYGREAAPPTFMESDDIAKRLDISGFCRRSLTSSCKPNPIPFRGSHGKIGRIGKIDARHNHYSVHMRLLNFWILVAKVLAGRGDTEGASASLEMHDKTCNWLPASIAHWMNAVRLGEEEYEFEIYMAGISALGECRFYTRFFSRMKSRLANGVSMTDALREVNKQLLHDTSMISCDDDTEESNADLYSRLGDFGYYEAKAYLCASKDDAYGERAFAKFTAWFKSERARVLAGKRLRRNSPANAAQTGQT